MNARIQQKTIGTLTWSAICYGIVSTFEHDGQLTYTKTYVNGRLVLNAQRVNTFSKNNT